MKKYRVNYTAAMLASYPHQLVGEVELKHHERWDIITHVHAFSAGL